MPECVHVWERFELVDQRLVFRPAPVRSGGRLEPETYVWHRGWRCGKCGETGFAIHEEEAA